MRVSLVVGQGRRAWGVPGEGRAVGGYEVWVSTRMESGPVLCEVERVEELKGKGEGVAWVAGQVDYWRFCFLQLGFSVGSYDEDEDKGIYIFVYEV